MSEEDPRTPCSPEEQLVLCEFFVGIQTVTATTLHGKVPSALPMPLAAACFMLAERCLGERFYGYEQHLKLEVPGRDEKTGVEGAWTIEIKARIPIDAAALRIDPRRILGQVMMQERLQDGSASAAAADSGRQPPAIADSRSMDEWTSQRFAAHQRAYEAEQAGNLRRAMEKETWHAFALLLLEAERIKNPHITAKQITDLVLSKWNYEKFGEKRSFSTVKLFFKGKMRKQGQEVSESEHTAAPEEKHGGG